MTKQAFITNKELLIQLPVFYQPWYLDIFDIEWDISVFGNHSEWILPYFIEAKRGFKICRPQPFMPYYGPFLLPNKKASEFPLKSFSKSFDYLLFAPKPDLAKDIFETGGFQAKERVTFLLDLKHSEDELLSNMDYMRRKNIKKAQNDLVIRKGDFDPILYFNWINATYARRGEKQTLSFSFFEKYISTVIKHGAALSYTIYNKEMQPLAMSLVLFDKETAYSILGANNYDIKHSAATTALLWEAIKDARNGGCHTFDFEGSRIPEIANFFSKFGGQRVDFFSWSKTNSLLWKLRQKLRG